MRALAPSGANPRLGGSTHRVECCEALQPYDGEPVIPYCLMHTSSPCQESRVAVHHPRHQLRPHARRERQQHNEHGQQSSQGWSTGQGTSWSANRPNAHTYFVFTPFSFDSSQVVSYFSAGLRPSEPSYAAKKGHGRPGRSGPRGVLRNWCRISPTWLILMLGNLIAGNAGG